MSYPLFKLVPKYSGAWHSVVVSYNSDRQTTHVRLDGKSIINEQGKWVLQQRDLPVGQEEVRHWCISTAQQGYEELDTQLEDLQILNKGDYTIVAMLNPLDLEFITTQPANLSESELEELFKFLR